MENDTRCWPVDYVLAVPSIEPPITDWRAALNVPNRGTLVPPLGQQRVKCLVFLLCPCRKMDNVYKFPPFRIFVHIPQGEEVHRVANVRTKPFELEYLRHQ